MAFLKFTDFKKSIIIFDLDDTLISGTARIKVTDDSGKSFEISTEEFATFKANPNQNLDLSQFRDPLILRNSRIKWPILNILKRAMSSSITVGIVTAREDKEMIFAYLNDYLGLKSWGKLDKSLVYCVNVTTKFSGSTPQRKMQAVEEIIKRGFNDITIYDDDPKNLKEIFTLQNENSHIKITTKRVKS